MVDAGIAQEKIELKWIDETIEVSTMKWYTILS